MEGDERVQDPYCIRCQPHVIGACLDLLRQAARTLEIEANAVTDNPLVLSDGSIVSGGNFHAEPVAFAADQIALATCEIGAITQRRIALLVDPALSHGLPAFLAKKPGLNSGLMIAEVTSAALMSENKQMSHPASVDSTPTSANQEDHVSMACHGARRLLAMTQNLYGIVGIEAVTAAQGVELRGPLETSPELVKALAAVRGRVASLEEDRYLAGDLAAAVELVADGSLEASVSAHLLPRLGAGHEPVEVRRGASPVILAFPHTGTEVPPDIAARLNAEGAVLRDTDWHIHRLYDGLLDDATSVRATFHRYCIDANRDPSGASLYPGQNTTGLVPATNFDGEPIWREGEAPDEAEVAERVARFHAPYHAALLAEIERVKALHGVAIVYDCHSIRSVIPFLFEGVLPDFNIGTDGGRTCDPSIEQAVAETCAQAEGHTCVLNGRFRGGGPPVTTAGPRRKSTPSRWSWRRRATSPPRRRPSTSIRSARIACARRFAPFSAASKRLLPRSQRPPDDQSPPQHPRRARRHGHRSQRQELADRSAAAHADEQSRPRRRGEPARARRLRRHRPRRAHLDDFDRIAATLRTLNEDETLLVQSGKPVGVFRTHKDAPRVLNANSNLVPHWATWDHFNELDKRGLACTAR